MTWHLKTLRSEYRQNILWHKLYQCFLRSVSQGSRNKSKSKQMGPNQTYRLLYNKGNHKPNKNTFYRLGEDICKWPVLNMEKAMAPHSSTLAWKTPWMEEPVRLRSIGSLRVRHDWATSLSLFTFMHWRRKWQPTPVFLPGESQGRGSLVGCHLWGHTDLDMTEVT